MLLDDEFFESIRLPHWNHEQPAQNSATAALRSQWRNLSRAM